MKVRKQNFCILLILAFIATFSLFQFQIISVKIVNAVPAREAILWFQKGYLQSETKESVGAWAIERGFDVLGWRSPNTPDAGEIPYYQSLGLKVLHTHIFSGSDPVVPNWVTWWNDINSWLNAFGFDGVVADDTHNLWYVANLYSLNATRYYENFLTNASITSNIYGKDYTIIEASIYGDDMDFNDMKNLNSSQATFSYYYPPNPQIRYKSPIIACNMSTSAWNMTEHYDNWGLADYYHYQGWLWFEDQYYEDRLSTYTILKTFNSILELADNYNVTQLWIYSFTRIFENPRLEPLIEDVITNWKSDTEFDADKTTTLMNLKKYYWAEPFAVDIENQTDLTPDGWQIRKTAPNYDYSTTSGKLKIDFNGTNTAYEGIQFLREIGSSEEALTISLQLTPYSYSSWKQIVLRSDTPYYYAYILSFDYGTSQNMTFQYLSANSSTYTVDTHIDIYKTQVPYTVTFNLNETYFKVTVTNSSWNWNQAVYGENYKWNSIQIHDLMINDYTGTWATPINYHSMDIDNIQLSSYNRSLYNIQDYFSSYVSGQVENETITLYGYSGINETGYNDLQIEGATSVTIIGDYAFKAVIHTYIYFTIRFFVPIINFTEYTMLAIGLVGIGMILFSPSWLAWKIKQGGDIIEIGERGMYVMLIFIVGLGLVFVWLWG